MLPSVRYAQSIESLHQQYFTMQGVARNVLIVMSLTEVLTAPGPLLVEDGEDGLVFLPGTSCEESPPCPDGKVCEMIDPPCYSRVCDNELVPACVYTVFEPKLVTQEEEYIRLPGKNCDEAPPCPDDRDCIMDEPKCYSRHCNSDPIPTCAFKHPY